MSVMESQLQLAPRATDPENPATENGCELAAGAPKCRGCGPWKSSSTLRSYGCERSTRTSCPPGFSRAFIRDTPGSSRTLQHRAAARAGAGVPAGVEALEHRRQLLLDVRQLDEFLVQELPAAVAVPLEAVALAGSAPPLDDEADRVGGPLRGMRHVRRQQQDFSLADRHLHPAAVLHGPQHDVAFELIEEFLSRIDMVVLPGV